MAEPANFWERDLAAQAGPTLRERDIAAGIVQSGASAASSAASAEETRRLLPSKERKAEAEARKAQTEVEQAEIALDKVKNLRSKLPPVEDLSAAQNSVLVELRNLAEAKRLSRTGAFATGFGASTAARLSDGSPAASVLGLLAPVKANTAFSTLSDMRAKSPTGGALGNVSDRELQLLYSVEGVMDPTVSDKVFQQGMDDLIKKRISVLNRLNASPEQIAEVLGEDNIDQFAPLISAYRFRKEDEDTMSEYIKNSKQSGTFDPTEYATMMATAYYSATGRQPDEKFIVDAVKTGREIGEMKGNTSPAFDYSKADKAAQGFFTSVGKITQPDGLTLGEALGEGALNLIPSTFDLAVNTVKALTVDLPETIEGAAAIIAGATGLSDDKTAVNALVDYYSNRYGSYDGFKKAIAEDPASILADIAGVATLGSTSVAGSANLASKIGNLPRLAKVAQGAEGFGRSAAALDPLVASARMAGAGLKGAGAVVKGAAVGVPARAAGVTIGDVDQSFGAGRRGSTEFLQQMLGEGPPIDPVAKAKAGLSELYTMRGDDYTREMAKLKRSPEVLDPTDVLNAIDGVRDVGRYKGIDISSASDTFRLVDDKVDEFMKRGLNSIEDFDAMKRAVGNIRDLYQVGTPNYKVAKDVANAINKVITDKAPVYAKVMGDYRIASDTLSDIQSSLSLGSKSADTALNKLRRNASGKGPRGRTVLNLLESTPSGKGLGDILAGQTMSGREAASFTPGFSSAAALMTGGIEPLVATAMTPRRLGELAYGAGSLAGGAERLLSKVPGADAVQDATRSLFDKYADPAASTVRVLNPPLIQPQVSEFEPAPERVDPAILERLLQQYSPAFPQIREAPATLEELMMLYREKEEEDVEGFASGGRVFAPRAF